MSSQILVESKSLEDQPRYLVRPFRNRLSPLSLSLKNSKKPETWFGTRGSEVQILSPRPFKIQQKSKIFDVCPFCGRTASWAGLRAECFYPCPYISARPAASRRACRFRYLFPALSKPKQTLLSSSLPSAGYCSPSCPFGAVGHRVQASPSSQTP